MNGSEGIIRQSSEPGDTAGKAAPAHIDMPANAAKAKTSEEPGPLSFFFIRRTRLA